MQRESPSSWYQARARMCICPHANQLAINKILLILLETKTAPILELFHYIRNKQWKLPGLGQDQLNYTTPKVFTVIPVYHTAPQQITPMFILQALSEGFLQIQPSRKVSLPEARILHLAKENNPQKTILFH